jgi:Zn-dependent protease with chaperone function
MTLFALLPFLLSAVLFFAAGPLAARCTPHWAVRALVLTALITSLSTGLVLSAAACLSVAEIPVVARIGHWSADALADQFAIPAVVGIISGLLAAGLAGAALSHVVRTARRLARTTRECRALGPGVNGLVIVDDERVGAYAVPGRPGRTVVSKSLLRALKPAERRAVLAHENAHLEHRHFLYVQLAALAAAANPLLRPVTLAVRRAVESWADEDAVSVVGERRTVACAVAKAGLIRAQAGASPLPSVALGAASGSDLALRIDNLLEPHRRRTGRCLAAVVAVAAACTVCAGTVAVHAHGTWEAGESRHVHAPFAP